MRAVSQSDQFSWSLELRARTAAHLRAGNKDAAAQHALRLQTVTRELAENRAQMEQAETTYKDLIRARDVAVNAARAKIESLKGAINDMRMKTAMAEMNEMASGMIGQIGTLLGAGRVNIANMQVSRNNKEGRAMMFMSVDSEVSKETLNLLQGIDGITQANLVKL